MDIWAECLGQIQHASFIKEIFRVVESQEQVATNKIVNNLDEQAILEQLLEQNKPPAKITSQELHYLLHTPFRYPPLPHGSRFSSRFEPSLFYASLQTPTALAETAYYRLLFWWGMSEPPPSAKLNTQHLIFAVNITSQQSLQLQHSPFDQYFTQLTDRQSYSATQLLGKTMREQGIEAFEYCSARDINHGVNIALFTPRVFSENSPHTKQQWLCETTAENVSFFHGGSSTVLNYSLSQFLVKGRLPEPAT